jgi:hypothetical protein
MPTIVSTGTAPPFACSIACGMACVAFLWQAQAVAELKLGLEEVRLEPVDGCVLESVGEEAFGGRTGDAPARGDDLFVLLLDDRIANAGLGGGHLCTAMAEDGHDRLDASAPFSELCPDGVAKAVRGHGGAIVPIEKASLATGDPERFCDR